MSGGVATGWSGSWLQLCEDFLEIQRHHEPERARFARHHTDFNAAPDRRAAQSIVNEQRSSKSFDKSAVEILTETQRAALQYQTGLKVWRRNWDIVECPGRLGLYDEMCTTLHDWARHFELFIDKQMICNRLDQ